MGDATRTQTIVEDMPAGRVRGAVAAGPDLLLVREAPGPDDALEAARRRPGDWDEDTGDEIEVDYSYIAEACARAAAAPDIVLSDDDVRALRTVVTDFSYDIEIEDEEQP